MAVTIYHNPACGTSRNVLAMIRQCRPSEAVLEILPNPDIGPFAKEDGEVVRAPTKPSR